LGWRLVVALVIAVALAIAAMALLQVDGDLGPPMGPDRLIDAIDHQAAPGSLDVARARSILRASPDDGRGYRVLARIAALESFWQQTCFIRGFHKFNQPNSGERRAHEVVFREFRRSCHRPSPERTRAGCRASNDSRHGV
jgi:hypothetical protein